VTQRDPVHHSARWRRVRADVLHRDDWQCQIRGPKCQLVATTVDHITALCDGGSPYDPANLRAACTMCNYGRDHGAKHATWLRRAGYTYRNTLAPTETRL
jgi:5-methylcytosine-specific restriction endonuclease McrA